MEYLQTILPLIVYVLLILLLIIGIILGVKFIKTMTKIEKVVDDVNDKVESLNGFFHVIDFTTDKIVALTDVVVDKISMFISRIFAPKDEVKKNKRNKED